MKRLSITAIAALAIAMPALAQQMGGGGSGGGGGDGVTSVATACGITGGPITGAGTVQDVRLVNAQSGTAYSLQTTDCGKLVTASNASAFALSLLAPGTAGNGYWFELQTLGAGTARLTPAAGQINGAAFLDVPQGQGVTVATDGSNYFAVTGLGGSGAVSSVFGRAGAVAAQSGDYGFAQISGMVAASQLPTPGAAALGGVQAKDCSSGGQFVQTINTDGTETCGTPAGGGNVSTAGTLASGNVVTGAGSQSVQDGGVALSSLLRGANNLSDVASVAAGRANLGVDQRTAHGDSAYSIAATDHYVVTTAAFTAARTWTLPALSGVNEGDTVAIADDAGGVTGTNTLTIRPNGASDTLNGVNFGGGGTLVISNARGAATCKANVSGTNWECVGSVVGSSAPTHQFANGLTAGGSLAYAQPAASDVSGLATVATSGSASDLGSGTLPAARLPTPAASTLGGVESKDCTSGGQFVQTINTDGSETCATPAGGGNVSTGGTLGSGNLVTGAGSQSVGDSGVAFPTVAAHQALVATSASVLAAKTLPDCTDSGGNHLNYTQSTDSYSCGTSSSGGGGGTVQRGALAGLTMWNDGTTPNTKIDVGTGQAADDTGAAYLTLASTTVLNFGATGINALDAGAIGASKSYGIFIVNGGSGTGVLATLAADWTLAGNGTSTGCSATANSTALTLSSSQASMYNGQPIQIFAAGVGGAAFNTTVASFSGTSVTLTDKPPVTAAFTNCDGGGFNPTLPTGYATYKRYIGSVLSDGSSHIYGFTQKGDQFMFANSGVQSNNAAAVSNTARQGLAEAIPHGVKVRPIIEIKIAGGHGMSVLDPDTTDIAPNNGNPAPGMTCQPNCSADYLVGSAFYSDFAGRYWIRADASGATVYDVCYGWFDDLRRNQ